MATARSGTFLAVHALDDARTAQSARGKALGLGEGRGHREFVGVHADKDAADGAVINANESADLRTDTLRSTRIRSTSRMNSFPEGAIVFRGALKATGKSMIDVAAAIGVTPTIVRRWCNAEGTIPADCIWCLMQRLPDVGVEILLTCEARLPNRWRNVFRDKLPKLTDDAPEVSA